MSRDDLRDLILIIITGMLFAAGVAMMSYGIYLDSQPQVYTVTITHE